MEFKPKDQIAYIPFHAEGNKHHPDVEFGFVMKPGGGFSFCRYWLKDQPGILRTTSCSESTQNSCLVKFNLCTPGEIEVIYKGIKANE